MAIAVATIALFLSPSAGADENLIVSNLLSNETLTRGDIHAHTFYSDGVCPVAEVARLAKAHGAEFLVITDHFEDIDVSDDEYDEIGNPIVQGLRYIRQAKKQSGIANYIQDCRNATNEVGILVIPGIEVGIGTDRDWVYDPAGGDNWDNKIHMLGIGAIDEATASRIHAALGHERGKTYSKEEKTHRLDDVQDEIAAILDEAGLAVIIAHPYITDAIHGFQYTVYKNKMDHVHGIEFFNDSGNYDEKSLEAMGFMKRDETMGPYSRDLAVIAGCDYHGIPGTGGEELFDKQTAIAAELPLYWSDTGYAAACQTVADALRGGGLVAAYVKQGSMATIVDTAGRAITTGSTFSTGIYQNGEKAVNGLDVTSDKLDQSKPCYFHIPGIMIARFNSESKQKPQEYSHNRNRERENDSSDYKDLGGLVTIETRDVSVNEPATSVTEQSVAQNSSQSRAQSEYPYPFPAGDWRVENPEVPNIKHSFTISPGGNFTSLNGPALIGSRSVITVFVHNNQLEWTQYVYDFYSDYLTELNKEVMRIVSVDNHEPREWKVRIFDPQDNETRDYIYKPEWDWGTHDYKEVELISPYTLHGSITTMPPSFPCGTWKPKHDYYQNDEYYSFDVDTNHLVSSDKERFMTKPPTRYLTANGNKLNWEKTWPEIPEYSNQTIQWIVLAAGRVDSGKWLVEVYCPELGEKKELYYMPAPSSNELGNYRPIHVTVKCDGEVYLYIAWHDVNGWHNTDFSSGTILQPSDINVELFDGGKAILADTIRYWARTSRGNKTWNKNNQDENIIATADMEAFLLTF